MDEFESLEIPDFLRADKRPPRPVAAAPEPKPEAPPPTVEEVEVSREVWRQWSGWGCEDWHWRERGSQRVLRRRATRDQIKEQVIQDRDIRKTSRAALGLD